MGIGPPVIELYRQLKLAGALDGIGEVMELGSQDFWCPQVGLIRGLFAAFGRGDPPPALLGTSATQQRPARELYEALGMTYNCIDLDDRPGTLRLDLNFDTVPADHHGRYGLVTNHGTSEHLLNQLNVFTLMHQVAKRGGVMLHVLPFTVHLEHGFFNYQPNLFTALARANGYDLVGVWVGPDAQLSSLIPWEPALLDYLAFNSRTTHFLCVALRKLHDAPFCVPFQEIYESAVPDEVRARYSMVVDGQIMDGLRMRQLTKDAILAQEYLPKIQHLQNVIDSFKGKVDGLQHELAVTRYHLDQTRYGGAALPPAPDMAPPIASFGGRELLRELGRRLARRLLPASRRPGGGAPPK